MVELTLTYTLRITLGFKKMSIWDVKDHLGRAVSYAMHVWSRDDSRSCYSGKGSF